jgi:hypothetical protein
LAQIYFSIGWTTLFSDAEWASGMPAFNAVGSLSEYWRLLQLALLVAYAAWSTAMSPEFDTKTPILRFWRSRLHMNQ